MSMQKHAAPNNVAHFAIHADDLPRARAFYENVFGWSFQPWGPPDFFLIQTSQDETAIHGALQKRRTPVDGEGMIGFECSVSVADVDASAASIEEHGGTITFPKMTIPTVGYVVQFRDTEGNVACVVQYDANAA